MWLDNFLTEQQNKRLRRILSNDFATVYLCEEPCQTEPPEKGKHGGRKREENEKCARGDDKAAICKRVSANAASSPLFVCSVLTGSVCVKGKSLG